MRHLCLPLLAALALAGCARGPGRQAVAVVNGSVISAADVAAMLPENLDSARADTLKRKVLEGLITRKLFAQVAVREGMEKDAEYQVELEQKALVNKRLYDAITAPGNRLSEMELQSAYKLLGTEAHLRVISVAGESLARRLSIELDRGAVFESLAMKYSKSPSAVKGGDAGFRPYLYIDEPLRTRVMVLKPGQHTQPTLLDDGWQIALLVETRPGNPPPLAEYRQEMEYRLKTQRRREMASQYLAGVRKRITYNPAGLDIMCKPLDSITDQEKEVAVAYKDQARYVKVARLLSVAARFPATLDTAMKKYAVRRAIEEDLIYEDALNRGLAKAPEIVAKLADTREEVLYRALYKREVTDKLVVTDADVMDYFRANRQNFTSPDSSQVHGLIRNKLQKEQREARLAEYLAGLKAQAKITVNDAALRAVQKPPRVPDNSKR